jgi:3-hydroxyethyl bacteriochlorophyllide a dehydrogenase
MSDRSARAVVFAEAGRLDLRDVALREPASDEVVVETRFSSISAGTERLLFGGALPGFPFLRFPLVPGYEAAGVVTERGSDVHDVRVGDEVFVGGSMCYTDVAAAFGGQSSQLIKKAAQVVPLHGIPLAHAPLIALAATSLHGIRRLGDVRGKRIGVIGMGAIGQFAARFALDAGAIVSEADSNPERLGKIAGVTPFSLAAAPAAPVHGHGHGHGGHGAPAPALFDVIVEATGKSELIATCTDHLALRGAILLLSYYDRLECNFVPVFLKEPSLIVSREWDHDDLLLARDAIADGRVAIADLAGDAYPIDRYESAYAAAFGDPSTLKVILQWA